MDQAASREGDEVGLALAPAREGGGPLPGAADLVGVLAGEDHAAIDDAGDDRGELAGGHRHHRLVEQAQPLLETPVLDQDVAPLVRGEREQVRIAEALGDRRRLARGGGGPLPVAARLLFEDRGHEQIAALDAITLLAIEQPLGASEPAARAAHLATPGQRDADPERAPKRRQLPARREVGPMGALEEADGSRPRGRSCTRRWRAARGRPPQAGPTDQLLSGPRRRRSTPRVRRGHAPVRARRWHPPQRDYRRPALRPVAAVQVVRVNPLLRDDRRAQ